MNQEMNAAIESLFNMISEDYNGFSKGSEERKDEFRENLDVDVGRKYIRIVKKLGSQHMVWGFIVNTQNDAKFSYGDILKAATWKSPTRNAARGNVFDLHREDIQWTGPCYL